MLQFDDPLFLSVDDADADIQAVNYLLPATTLGSSGVATTADKVKGNANETGFRGGKTA